MQLLDIGRSQLAVFAARQTFIDEELQATKELINERRRIELIGVTEGELATVINQKYDALLQKEEERARLSRERLRQEQIFFNYREQELVDNRELVKLDNGPQSR